MPRDDSLPSYARLFVDGEIDLREEDEARSVYSPAAYLAELLRLLENAFGEPSLLDRRPDLKKIILNAENTFTESPYLDIVNEVLEKLLGAEPYEILRRARFPFLLPFSLRNEQFKAYLREFKVGPEEFYRLFAPHVDGDVVARMYLGLALEEAEVVTTPSADEAGVKERFGVGAGESLEVLGKVERFRAATGLSALELRELLLLDPASFVHQGQPVSEVGDELAGVSVAWFERVGRLVRLAGKIGVSLSDLDRVLGTCCGNRLDSAALRTIAVVVHLQRVYQVGIAAVCGLVVAGTSTVSGDILAPHNKRDLARSIGMAESDIVGVVRRYRERYGAMEPSPFDRGQNAAAVALLQRVGQYVSVLGIPVSELFELLDVLESDPSVRRYTTFSLLEGEFARDCYRILEGGEAASCLWLAETLFAVVGWMQVSGFSGRELVEILGGSGVGAGPGSGAESGQDAAALDALYQRFESVALTPDTFVSRRFGDRASQVVHDVLTAYDDGVVSARDARLLRLDPGKAAAAAYDAVTDLGVIVGEDFLGIGLGERLAGKIYAGLVFTGWLGADGRLAREVSGPITLGRDFEAFREPLFKLIGSVGNGTSSFFPSDLAMLADLGQDLRDELYDNLLYHGYVDSEGNLPQPGFFADEANLPVFVVNARLDDVAEAAGGELAARVERFRSEALTLDPAIFDELRLTASELAELVESLRFNGYVDENGVYLDKEPRAEDFGLALEFYPVRRAVLEAMKRQVAAFRDGLYTFTAEDFGQIADEAMARRVIDDPDGLAGFSAEEAAVVSGRMSEITQDQRPYRLDLDAVAELGFDEGERDRLVEVLAEAGYLDEGLAVAEDRIGYFRTVANALTFSLPGLEDFSKDLFFLLNAVAKEIAAGVAEITATLDKRAERQRAALSEVLADAFGLPAATVEAICAAVVGGAAEVLDTLVAPVLAAGDEGRAPTEPHFRQAYRRIGRFALLAAKLGMDATEVAVAFRDQDLTGKYPEPLALPPGIDRFDALLESSDGHIYLFGEGGCWVYDRATYALTDARPAALSSLFPGLARVDAAFARQDGAEWVVGRGYDGASRLFVREQGSTRWRPREQVWGKVRNTFDDARKIDAAYVDEDGRTHLYCGDQYVRYSGDDYTFVDEGFPRGTGGPIDASFQDTDGGTHVFTGDTYQGPGGHIQQVADKWGRFRNNFDKAHEIDAAYSVPGGVQLFSGNQVVRYTDSVENDGVQVDDGYPQRLWTWWKDLPGEFASGVEAVFADLDGVVHVFKDGMTSSGPTRDGRTLFTPAVATADRWGQLPPALPSGRVEAAFTGLDGKTYLFSGEKYVRYSGSDYLVVDLGYPRSIAGDWGGLRRVGASFVMDGQTYLFGEGGLLFELPLDQEAELDAGRLSPALRRRFAEHGLSFAGDVSGHGPEWRVMTEQYVPITLRKDELGIKVYADEGTFYVRYSTRNYTVPDQGFPKPVADNWWNLPATLAADPAFVTIDEVFTGRDGRTYLFAGDRYVVFDSRHRWWSEPRSLREHWDSLPFDRVDAAFVGPDGRTYVFSGDEFVRYSTGDHTEVDDRYPAVVSAFWGNVKCNLARSGRVDAALVLDGSTYLFSGDQYVRYEGGQMQDGYPRAVAKLALEPRLTNLPVVLDGVDAAYADRRNVYLFRGTNCHVVSDTLYRRYDQDPVRCAFIEDGSLMAEGADGWRRLSSVEGATVTATPARPRVLRSVPEEFRTGLDSVLRGADGNTYLFKGTSCYNTRLNREYPLTEEWGRPRNAIYQDNVVDAAFVGRDGRTYLFSGDQFVVYTGTSDTVDGDPRLIEDHWNGLTSVTLAYVRAGQTYLFERPAEDGSIRYLVYPGPDYQEPIEPRSTDETYWALPEDYGVEGVPDAVLFEADTMLLLYGDRCVQFNETTRAWSYPRPLTRIWRNFRQIGTTLRAAFTQNDTTHFFFDHDYTSYANLTFTPPAPIRDRWGRSRNPFILGDSPIDAAFVYRHDTTYLFSGDRYVRYTGPEYRHIDPGYPKPLTDLRHEEAFANLPETFDEARVDAIVANQRTVYIFAGAACHTVSRTATATYDVDRFGKVRNTIAERGRVDATLVAPPFTHVFSGDQFITYKGTEYELAEGPPNTIGDSLPKILDTPALPDDFADGLDAAFKAPNGTTYLFKGQNYLRGAHPEPIAGAWGKVRNAFTGAIDAAFTAPTGELYAFNDGQFVRYRKDKLDYVEEGYPRTVRDDWGDLPRIFEEEGPDGAFVFEGRTYLLKNDQYVRYSGAYSAIGRTFPQSFTHRWSNTADYRLTDLHTIVRFVDLARAHPGGLAEFLGDGAVEDPYRYLADLFGWDVDEIRWARRNSALLTRDTREEERFEIEFLLKLSDLFATSDKFGIGPSALYTDVWSQEPEQANAALSALVQDESAPSRLHDELNVLKRDALIAAVGTSHDLYERYLIDVDMGPEGRTSRIREAIAATQLYLHRYLLNLEQEGAGEDVRRRLKTWWAWMRNYRVWEANRKVFLYPENYLRPELRQAKTPAFAALEGDLLQGEITQDTVQRAYKRYLDEYTEVSRLAIAGGYVYKEDGADAGTRKLVLFGRTRTEPRRYYCREAEFRDGEQLSATWEPWLKVDVQIDAERVHPVHAFGRVFVFWTVVETVAPDNTAKTTLTTHKEGEKQDVSIPTPAHRLKIYYSFRNLNHEWVPAQLLPADERKDGPISDVSLYVQASSTVPGKGGDEHDTIVVSCKYLAGATWVKPAFALTPELYAVRVQGAVAPPRAVKLNRIFNEPVAESGVVQLNMPAESQDGPWLSVDHKGGSFLCRPISAPGGDERLLPLKGNEDLLPTTWDRIDAAFELPDKTRYFFDNAQQRYIVVGEGKSAARQSRQDVSERWGLIGNTLFNSGVVDAVLVRKDHTFVFSGPDYYRYSGKPFGPLDAGYPMKLATNTEDLPRWTKVDAAYTAVNGTEFFVSHQLGGYAQAPALTTVKPIPWPVPKVDAVFLLRNHLYVCFGDQYARFTGEGAAPDKGYPRPLAKNEDGLPQSVSAAFGYGGGAYFFDNAAGTYTNLTDTWKSRDLGRRIGTAIARTGMVDAAYVADGRLYLTKDLELVRYTLSGGSIPDAIDDGYPKTLAKPVKAVFERNGQRYVFSGGDYAVLDPGKEPDKDLVFDPVNGNWGGLPSGFESALESSDLFLFSHALYTKYPSPKGVQRPYEFAGLPHDIVRLTSSTAYKLNRELLVGGVSALLAPETQETDELPAFSDDVSNATTIRVNPQVVDETGPASTHLDFQSANGIYYWELFFHAPVLIAQALNGAQRFDDARTWYEYVFDPTEPAAYWRFLPFLSIDVRALAEGCRHDLRELEGVEGADALARLLGPKLDQIEALAPAFQQVRAFERAEIALLADLADNGLDEVTRALDTLRAPAESLREQVAMLARLKRQYDLLGNRDKLIRTYMDDPFDPHAIAELRPSAYRRAVVMAYIDNLLDWGDLLFRQYTAESVDEARMLYIFAYDLLGRAPENLGPRALPPERGYEQLDEVAEGTGLEALTGGGALLEGPGEVHASVADTYFYVPENADFLDYWTRVEDRLRKIRQSQDILGISRPLPLFEPPADVMALVRGAASGVAPDQLTAGAVAQAPLYRFAFLFRKAQDLVDRVRQFGNDLLNVLERGDGEELALLQNRQEGVITAMTRAIKEAQVTMAAENRSEVEVSRKGAVERVAHYQKLISDGMSPLQVSQVDMMSRAAVAHFVGSGLKVGSAIAYVAPQVLVGPFIIGTQYGGVEVGQALDKGADVATTFAEGLSVLGELFGLRNEYERTVQDWNVQLGMARSDVAQLGHQLAAAEQQMVVARRELEILNQEIVHLNAVATFLKDKFANVQLYRWMSGRLSGLYFQTYNLAYESARAAEQAYRFERGSGDGTYIRPTYWESLRSGLLAGESLGLDLERLGQAYAGTDRRGLEITKKVSLLALDPLALLSLRSEGRCEFALTEALFDRDFPGHYGRRIKTVSVAFETADGPVGINATLTQLDNKTVMEPDPKAVKFLLDPKGSPPATVRGDWRPSQQIALSDLEEYKENNGLFELRYDDDRYLPFEGTGAVSRWRLELSGKRAPALREVTITVKYAADQGGEVFAAAVKGMLKPYPTARFFDVAAEFPDQWAEFAESDGNTLVLPLTPELLPGISGRQITGVLARYEATGPVRFLLNGDRRLALDEGRLLRTPGLSVGATAWVLVLEGDKAQLTNVGLILAYRAGVQ